MQTNSLDVTNLYLALVKKIEARMEFLNAPESDSTLQYITRMEKKNFELLFKIFDELQETFDDVALAKLSEGLMIVSEFDTNESRKFCIDLKYRLKYFAKKGKFSYNKIATVEQNAEKIKDNRSLTEVLPWRTGQFRRFQT